MAMAVTTEVALTSISVFPPAPEESLSASEDEEEYVANSETSGYDCSMLCAMLWR